MIDDTYAKMLSAFYGVGGIGRFIRLIRAIGSSKDESLKKFFGQLIAERNKDN